MIRRLLTAILALSLISTLLPSGSVAAGTEPFTDVPADHPDRQQILYLVERKLIQGYPDGRFGPEEPLNRDAAVKIATQVAGLAPRTEGEALGFSDLTEGHWSAPFVRAAVFGGLVKGFDDGTFRPGQRLTRAELAVLALRAARQPMERAPAISFGDVKRTDWFYAAAALAVAAGFMEAPGDRFRPGETATRAEAARAFAQAMVYTPGAFSLPMQVAVTPERGTVEIAQPGSEEFVLITGATPLPVGGRVRTGAASAASMAFPDGSSLYLDALSELVLIRSRGTDLVGGMAVEELEVELLRGQLFGALVPRLSPDELTAYGTYLTAYNDGEEDDRRAAAVMAPRVRAASGASGENLPAEATRLLLFANPGSMEPGDSEGVELTIVMADEAGQPVAASRGPVPLQLLSDVGRFSDTAPVIPEGLEGVSVTLYPPEEEPEDAKTRVTAVAGEVTSALTVPTAEVNWWQALFTKKTRAKVRMPYSVASIRGSFISAGVSAEGNVVTVLGGEATLRSASGDLEELRENQRSRVGRPDQPPTTPEPMPLTEQRVWLGAREWVGRQVEQIQQAAPKIVEKAVKDEHTRIQHLVTMLPEDKVSPSVSLSAPETTGSRRITVRGSASDDVKLASVTVGGRNARVDPSGAFEAELILSPGSNTITAVAVDSSGNASTADLTVQFDSSLPSVSLSAARGARGKQAELRGKVTAPAGVQSLTVNGVPVTPEADGSFVLVADLKEGSNQIVAEVTDRDGRGAIERIEVMGAGLPPAVSLDGGDERVAREQYVVTGSVTVAAVGLKQLRVNGKPALAGSDGSFTAAVQLKPGQNVITVEAEDRAGNTASASKTVTLDGGAPSVRIIRPKEGYLTRDGMVTVEGQVKAAAGIRSVTVGGRPASVDADGAFSAEVTLGAGESAITVAVVDVAGRTASDSRTVLRAGAPPSLSIDYPSDGQKVATPGVTVSGSAAAKVGPLRTVTVNGKPMMLGAGGSFSSTVRLEDGENQVTVEATDMAGNSAVSVLNVFYDGAAPSLRLSSPVNGLVTNKAELVVSGTVENGESVREVLVGGTPTAVGARGSFSATVQLKPGANEVAVVLPDGGKEVRTVFLASAPPSLSIGAPAEGFVSTVSEVTVSGMARSSTGKPAKVRVDGKVAAVDVDGAFAYTVRLKSGANVITVSAEDEAGNEVAAGVTVNYEPAQPGKDAETKIKPGKLESTEEKEPSDNEKEPGDNEKEPGDNEKEPGDNEKEPGDNEKQPGDNEKEPGDNEKEPGDNEKEPGNNEKEPGDNEKEPGDNEKEPGKDEKEPGKDKKEPGNDEKGPGNDE